MERQLHWHHSHCQARYGSNEQQYGGGVHRHGFNGPTKPAYGRRTAAIHSGWHGPHGSYISLSCHPWGFNWHGSIGPNRSTGSASRYRRPAKLGDDTALTGQSPQQWLASRGIHGSGEGAAHSRPPLAHRPCRTKWASPFRGTSYLTGSWLSLRGFEPSPGFTGTPMGAGEFPSSLAFHPTISWIGHDSICLFLLSKRPLSDEGCDNDWPLVAGQQVISWRPSME